MSAAHVSQPHLPGLLLQCMHALHICKIPTGLHFGERNMSSEQPCLPIPWHGFSMILPQGVCHSLTDLFLQKTLCSIQQAALQTELAAQYQHELGAALEAQGARLAAEHDALLSVS